MASPIVIPRLNSNDDHVRLVSLAVPETAAVRKGDVLAVIETDKISFEIPAPGDGVLLRWDCRQGSDLTVGAILGWLGEDMDEQIPLPSARVPAETGGRLTAKALARLAAEEMAPDLKRRAHSSFPPPLESDPVDGEGSRQAMARTVGWHATEAVPASLDIAFDRDAWAAAAKSFANQHRLPFSPLLGLLAFRLCAAAIKYPDLLITMVGDRFVRHRHLHIGLTMQSKGTLHFPVVANAGELDARTFVLQLFSLQKAIAAGRSVPLLDIRPVLALSSIGIPGIRHRPILPPYCSFIVGHGESDCISATYDHRVIDGYYAGSALRLLAHPEA